MQCDPQKNHVSYKYICPYAAHFYRGHSKFKLLADHYGHLIPVPNGSFN
jgi:hypothetical protein